MKEISRGMKNTNVVGLEGYISEIDVRKSSNTFGQPVISVFGTIEVPLPEGTHSIKFSGRANRYTANGTPNPKYESLEALERVRRRTTDGDNAEKVRLVGNVSAYFKEPKYWNIIISFVTLEADLKYQFQPKATFKIVGVVRNITPEMQYNGDGATGRYIIGMGVPQWDGNVEPINFIVASPSEIAQINGQVKVGMTIELNGYVQARPITSGSGKTVAIRELLVNKHSIMAQEESYDAQQAESNVQIYLSRSKEAQEGTAASVHKTPAAPMRATPPAPAPAPLYEKTGTPADDYGF